MNAWLADASSIPGQENGGFNPSTIDPSAAFLHASPTPQDPNQFQRMFNNGVPRNASPGFHNPNQVIPSKRPRPEDGMPMSPRPGPGGVTGSRSQTPHQGPYPGYQGPANGASQFQQHPTAYQQHLQQQTASPNVTQSPIMQQEFEQGSVRMGTASPSPFSPAGPHVGGASHMSPSQSDHGSRVNTPQNNNFMPGQGFPQGMAGQFQQVPGMSQAQQPSMPPQQMNGMQQMPQYHQAIAAQQQRLRAMQMQSQGQQMQGQQMPNPQMNMNPQMAGRPGPGGGMNPMGNPQQMAALRQMQQNIVKPNNPEMFVRGLSKFMVSRNLPFDANPIICGRQINLVQLYGTVMKMGGSKKVTSMNLWPAVAQHLSFPPMQFPTAAQEVRECHQRNLTPYEQAYFGSQQKQFDQMQQGGMPRQPSDPSAMQQFQSPSVKSGQPFEPPQQVNHSPQNNPLVPNTPQAAQAAQAAQANGFATPTQARSQSKPPQSGQRVSVSRPSQPPVPMPDGQFTAPSPSQHSKAATPTQKTQVGQPEQKMEEFIKKPIEDPFKPLVLTERRLHGPIAVDEMYQIGDDISRLRPIAPSFADLGIIDMHALTMSLKSGIHSEIRVSLDTLTTLSCEPQVQISLENCDDLVESLVDCAEDQADFLAQHTQETSDNINLRPYEDVVRGCHAEHAALADVPEFGSLDYELDRAVDRLICVTTILRNFSFSESNFGVLGIPVVTQFFAGIFRHIGTRKMFLRRDQNTLNLMKDAVIFIGNLAHCMQISAKEEARSLLHFLLAFSPLPEPTSKSGQVMFSEFNPSIHRYTPAAVDGLAKLLARDDPNRAYFAAIFAGDGSAQPQPDLLTRSFGLAISCVPHNKALSVVDARRVFLLQGLLAADVLTSFADGPMAKLWLGSVDGFAIHLLRLSCALCTDRIPQINVRQRAQEPDAYTFGALFHRGLAILRRLAEKSKQVDKSSSLCLPSGITPQRESLLGALLLPNLDPNIIRQLISYARLAE